MSDDAGARGIAVGDLLRSARDRLNGLVAEPRLEAELLLAHVTGWRRSTVMAFPEREVTSDVTRRYRSLIGRRGRGEPYALIVGQREFHGLMLEVTADTLVPRPETELLVEHALAALPQDRPGTVLDLGTGTGAIALAIKHRRPDADVSAVDVSEAALAVARRNAAALGLQVDFVRSHWFDALSDTRYDVVVSNPPYVCADDPALTSALRFEPRLALAAGVDGLAAIREIVGTASPHLWPHSLLLIEHGSVQRAGVAEVAAEAGLVVDGVHRDLAGHDRVTALRGARRAAAVPDRHA